MLQNHYPTVQVQYNQTTNQEENVTWPCQITMRSTKQTSKRGTDEPRNDSAGGADIDVGGQSDHQGSRSNVRLLKIKTKVESVITPSIFGKMLISCSDVSPSSSINARARRHVAYNEVFHQSCKPHFSLRATSLWCAVATLII
jgi:hypothetical protein